MSDYDEGGEKEHLFDPITCKKISKVLKTRVPSYHRVLD
jgi:hypothetical protein